MGLGSTPAASDRAANISRIVRMGDGLSAAPAPWGVRGRPRIAIPTMRIDAAVASAADSTMAAAISANGNCDSSPPVRGAETMDWNASHRAAKPRLGGSADNVSKPSGQRGGGSRHGMNQAAEAGQSVGAGTRADGVGRQRRQGSREACPDGRQAGRFEREGG